MGNQNSTTAVPILISASSTADSQQTCTTLANTNDTCLLTTDPRSPTEGISRTPIRLDVDNSTNIKKKKSLFKFVNGRKPTNDIEPTEDQEVSPVVKVNGGDDDIEFIDFNTLELLDSVMTEDDSLHRSQMADTAGSTTALSDTEIPSKTANSPSGFAVSHAMARLRRSLMEKRPRSSNKQQQHFNDSPSLFVRWKHREKYRSQQHQQAPDALPIDNGDSDTVPALNGSVNGTDSPVNGKTDNVNGCDSSPPVAPDGEQRISTPVDVSN